VGVVETGEPFVVLPVERERVGQPVGPFLRHGNLPNFEFHPILTLLVENQDLAVQIQKSVQAWIALRPALHA
jgi:hypothetical protein